MRAEKALAKGTVWSNLVPSPCVLLCFYFIQLLLFNMPYFGYATSNFLPSFTELKLYTKLVKTHALLLLWVDMKCSETFIQAWLSKEHRKSDSICFVGFNQHKLIAFLFSETHVKMCLVQFGLVQAMDNLATMKVRQLIFTSNRNVGYTAPMQNDMKIP